MTPPLLGIESCIHGPILNALDDSGHGRRIAVVDRSYNIPRRAERHNSRGGTSAGVLKGILLLTPVETKSGLIIMSADLEDENPKKDFAKGEFVGTYNDVITSERNQTVNMDFTLMERTRNDGLVPGFYSVANSEAEDTLFIKTPDDLPYACATFVIGHSQNG